MKKPILILLISLPAVGLFAGICQSKTTIAPEPDEVPEVVSVSENIKDEIIRRVNLIPLMKIKQLHETKFPLEPEPGDPWTPEDIAEQNFFKACIDARYESNKLFIMMMSQQEAE
jgi:hypothetical protein